MNMQAFVFLTVPVCMQLYVGSHNDKSRDKYSYIGLMHTRDSDETACVFTGTYQYKSNSACVDNCSSYYGYEQSSMESWLLTHSQLWGVKSKCSQA